MKILLTIQDYGREVTGGGETFTRLLAGQLLSRGHEVHVATSCARSYVGWANHYSPGQSEIDGIVVHRFPVRRERTGPVFGALDQRTVWGRKPVPLHMQEEWLRLQGPELDGYAEWLRSNGPDFDLVSVVTYLYAPAIVALRTLTGRVPLIMHPLAHDEPYINLPLFKSALRLADAFAFTVEEERDLIENKLGIRRTSEVVGIGTDLDVHGNARQFRAEYNLGDSPYLLFIGRVDPHKGSEELYEGFLEHKKMHPSDLKLVIMGEQIRSLEAHPDVICTGFVEEQTKRDGIVGALALAMPSYFESFSMVLTEAWSMGTPCLVQGNCPVTKGQALRSRGGIPYHGFAEFSEAVNMLMFDPVLREQLGQSGKRYTEANYDWSIVMDRYESLMERVVKDFDAHAKSSSLVSTGV